MHHEALGRLGFYINKFGIDLSHLNNPKILTDEGMHFHQQFTAGYAYICQKYQSVLAGLDYRNQPYTFQNDLFDALNPIHKTHFV